MDDDILVELCNLRLSLIDLACANRKTARRSSSFPDVSAYNDGRASAFEKSVEWLNVIIQKYKEE